MSAIFSWTAAGSGWLTMTVTPFFLRAFAAFSAFTLSGKLPPRRFITVTGAEAVLITSFTPLPYRRSCSATALASRM